MDKITTTHAGTMTVRLSEVVLSNASVSLAGLSLSGGLKNNASVDGMSLTAAPEISHWAMIGTFAGIAPWRWRNLRKSAPETAATSTAES